jgi:hypothetical protein
MPILNVYKEFSYNLEVGVGASADLEKCNFFFNFQAALLTSWFELSAVQ